MSLVTIPSPSLSPVSGGPKDKFEGHLAVAALRYPGNISRGPSHSTAAVVAAVVVVVVVDGCSGAGEVVTAGW